MATSLHSSRSASRGLPPRNNKARKHLPVQSPFGLVVEAQPDLSVYPVAKRNLKRSHEVTLGDLHGSTLKLVYFLIREGILKLAKTEAKSRKLYTELVRLYRAPAADDMQVERKFLVRFNAIINRAKISRTSPKVRLIGDEFADRGKNDYLTLNVLTKLHKSRAPFEIILSNHSLEFIKFYEHVVIQDLWYNPLIMPHQAASLLQFRRLIGVGDKFRNRQQRKIFNELKRFYEKVYLPHLKLISYSKGSPRLTLYSHAPLAVLTNPEGKTTIPVLPHLAAAVGAPRDLCNETQALRSEPDLVRCIDALNRSFLIFAQKHEIYLQTDREWENGDPHSWGTRPFQHITWNRLHEIEFKNHLVLEDGTPVNQVHGHDGASELVGNAQDGDRVNLDNFLDHSAYIEGPAYAQSLKYGVYHSSSRD